MPDALTLTTAGVACILLGPVIARALWAGYEHRQRLFLHRWFTTPYERTKTHLKHRLIGVLITSTGVALLAWAAATLGYPIHVGFLPPIMAAVVIVRHHAGVRRRAVARCRGLVRAARATAKNQSS